ncbi:MAG TPA: HAMP domain-containing sensor histidine kinase [Steroidobacteraceae bacterium]
MGDLAEWIHGRLGSGTERPVDDDGAQLLGYELGVGAAALPPVAEDGTLLVDLETRSVSEIHLGTEQKTVPPVPDAPVRNGHAFARPALNGNAVRDNTRQNLPLRQAQLRVEELASANRRKDEFLAMLSHELRSPLAAVRILGKQMGEDSAQQRMQALIERQLDRMTRLVDELLDVSRITTGRLHLQRARIDLRVVVGNAIATLESDLNERKQQLSVELPDAPVWLQADASRLEQVFVNLLGNASRYTDAGGELAVWVHTSHAQAVVRVRDSGTGISADALPHIFELFKQANADDPRSKSGLGVGLAVVRNLVELHGGSVTAASAGGGQGSEFTVRLPTSESPS